MPDKEKLKARAERFGLNAEAAAETAATENVAENDVTDTTIPLNESVDVPADVEIGAVDLEPGEVENQ